MEKTLILHVPHLPYRKPIRYRGTLEDLRAAMPELRFRVTQEFVNATDVEVTKHKRRVSRSGRQTCCEYCHTCGGKLRKVLDGELWCETCQSYK